METLQLAGIHLQLNPITAYVEQVVKGKNALIAVTQIKSKTDCDNATELLNKAKKLTSIIDKEVEAICRPIKDWKAKADQLQRDVKAEAEKLKQPITEPIRQLEAMITGYVREQREIQAKELARQQAIQKRIEEVSIRGLVFDGLKYASLDGAIGQDDMNDLEFDFSTFIKAVDSAITKRKKATEKKGEEFVMTGPEEIPVYCAPVVTTMPPEVKGMTTYWKHEIENMDVVPREFCSPDPVKINAAIKSGVRAIAGVRIYSEEKIKRTNV